MESLPADDVERASSSLSYPGPGFDTKSDMHITIGSDTDNTHVPATRVNEIGSLRRELYAYAFHDTWHRAKSIYDEFKDMVRIPLTTNGDTALHIAVSANSSTFVKEFVNLVYVTPKDLEITNVEGNTAFYMAAIQGNGDFIQIMIDKNKKLPLVPRYDGMLPVHLATLYGNHEIVKDLSSDNLLHEMDFKHIEQLFFMTIYSSMYDMAMKLLDKYSEKLVVATCGEQKLTALHVLMQRQESRAEQRWFFFRIPLIRTFYLYFGQRRPSIADGEELWVDQLELIKKLWFYINTQLEEKKIVELITQPSVILFDAIESGNIEAVKWLLYINRDLLTIKDPLNGRNLLHITALYNQEVIFDFILKMEEKVLNPMIRAVDKDGNNILHFAAHQLPKETLSHLTANSRMQIEATWFLALENKVPIELAKMRNKDGKTPIEILDGNHEEISKEVTELATSIVQPGMVVATLIAAIAFDAALNAPGDKSSSWFVVFILANTVGFFTSAAAVLIFLAIFIRSRVTSKSIGLIQKLFLDGTDLLLISTVALVVAFVAASFLIFEHKYKVVPYVVIFLGCLLLFPLNKFISVLTEKFGPPLMNRQRPRRVT